MKSNTYLYEYNFILDRLTLKSRFKSLMHRPQIRFTTINPPPSVNHHHFKISISLDENLKLKMLALNVNSDNKCYLKNLFKELMEIGSYPVIINDELNINPVDESMENKEWKINVHQIIDEYLNMFRLKLIGVPSYKYDLNRIKEKIKESEFSSKILYYLDEFNITHLLVHIDDLDLLDFLLISCLNETFSFKTKIIKDNANCCVTKVSSLLSIENGEISDYNFDNSMNLITIKDDVEMSDSDKSVENDILIDNDCSNISIINENEDRITRNIYFKNDESQNRYNLILELEEMNKDKKNPLYHLNELIIDNYYKESKRKRDDSVSSGFSPKKI